MAAIYSTETELAAYREHCRNLEDRVCDLRLELSHGRRVQDAVSQQLDWHTRHAAALQQRQDELVNQYRELEAHHEKTLRSLESAQRHAGHIGAVLTETQQLVHELATQRSSLEASLRHLDAEFRALRGSWSWRLTAPIRWTLRRLRGY